MLNDKDLLRACNRAKAKIESMIPELRIILGMRTNDAVSLFDSDSYITTADGVRVALKYYPDYMQDLLAGEYDTGGAFGPREIDYDISRPLSEENHFLDSFIQAAQINDWSSAEESLQLSYSAIENSSVNYHREEILEIVSTVSEALEILISSEFVDLYVSPRSPIEVSETFVEVDRRIAEAILKNPSIFDSMDPRYFEELVASIYSKLGFEVFLTKRTRDGGRDIVVVGQKAQSILKFIVECKRYRRDRKVGIAAVQRLWGVKVSEGATKAILATTASFSRPAKEFAQKHLWELDLVDYKQLLSLLKSYGRI
jgi:hypothetical protein